MAGGAGAVKRLVNRLRGQVRVRVECAFPERVMNLCGARGLKFWDLVWESETAFSCCLTRRDYAALRWAAEKLSCTLTVQRREGVPFLLARLRRRTVLAVGLVACGLGVVVGSFFVWDYQVEGNETVPTERILRALEKNGVGLGAFALSLDGEDIRNHVLLDIPELSWITVNVSGCRAHVQVRERVMPPEIVDEKAAANVVARRPGLVLEVRGLDGVNCVLPGASVTRGQLLISGVADTGTFGARILPGMGSVRARTWYALTTAVPLTGREVCYTGREKQCFSLVVGKRRVKFFRNSSIQGANYDKITTRHQLTLFGVPLPLTWVREVCRFYTLEEQTRPAAQVRRETEQVLCQQLAQMVAPYGAVRSSVCTAREAKGMLYVTLTAECEEEIGQRKPIYTEDTGA